MLSLEGRSLRRRVIDGTCPLYRITTSYKEGSGDKGKSEATVGKRLSKGDPSYKIHEICEELRLSLSKVLLIKDLTAQEKGVLSWIRNSTFSISSFCYCGGVSKDHVFPEEFLSYLELYIFNMKRSVGPAQDFLVWDSIHNILIDEVRVKVRELERIYTEWSLVCDSMASTEIDINKAVLNRLSSYFFWLNRSVGLRSGLKESYWTGSMGTFNIEDFS